MIALHNECLTRRNLLDRLNLLEGLLGFVLGVLRALEGLRKLRLLRLAGPRRRGPLASRARRAPWPLCFWPRSAAF